MLEEHDPSASTATADDSKSTGKIINKMLEDNEHHVDQEKVLTARLLDMLVADFDRHSDQWRWGTDDTGKGKLYYPIPRDRDQAFFKSNGFLVKFLKGKGMPFLEGFNENIRDIKGINYVAKDFDRFFLNNLDKAAWTRILNDFTTDMSDEVIKNAAADLPKELAVTKSDDIVRTLISRRQQLSLKALKYYDFLSERVSVTGSNKSEYFHIKKSDRGLLLTVYKKNDNTDSGAIMYNRIFKDNETKELVIYGLHGEDKFEIDDDVNSRIKLRLIGGKGNDTFNLRGNVLNFLYDLNTEKNAYINTRRTNREMGNNVSVIEYKGTGFEYNKIDFPLISLGYNEEDKFLIGAGFSTKTHSFRREPYSTLQRFTTLFAPSKGAYQARYSGIFNKVVSKYDLLVNGELVNPTLNNFYGLGNETVYNKQLPREYYRTRYKFASGDLRLRRRLNEIMNFSVGPTYYHYWNDYEDNKNRILGNPVLIGSDSASIFGKKDYLGGKFTFDISYINNPIITTRGITWLTEFSALKGLNANSKPLTKLTTDMTVYARVSDHSTLSAVIRVGAGHIFSKNYEYFQALNLGGNNYLRGFRKNRFTGGTLAYGSTEARLKLFTSKSFILPGDVGIVTFFDMGRTWERSEYSKKWHNSYGGGIYYIPYGLVTVSALVGISPEDKLFNFSIGTKFNLTF